MFSRDVDYPTAVASYDDEGVDAAIRMDGEAMQDWALANGWSGKNPERLAQYVRDINSGKRPHCRRVLRADYVDNLRGRAEEGE